MRGQYFRNDGGASYSKGETGLKTGAPQREATKTARRKSRSPHRLDPRVLPALGLPAFTAASCSLIPHSHRAEPPSHPPPPRTSAGAGSSRTRPSPPSDRLATALGSHRPSSTSAAPRLGGDGRGTAASRATGTPRRAGCPAPSAGKGWTRTRRAVPPTPGEGRPGRRLPGLGPPAPRRVPLCVDVPHHVVEPDAINEARPPLTS